MENFLNFVCNRISMKSGFLPKVAEGYPADYLICYDFNKTFFTLPKWKIKKAGAR